MMVRPLAMLFKMLIYLELPLREIIRKFSEKLMPNSELALKNSKQIGIMLVMQWIRMEMFCMLGARMERHQEYLGLKHIVFDLEDTSANSLLT
jgi:hypothetical protein